MAPSIWAQHRVLNVFFVLDVSGSMAGGKIAMLNRAVEETLVDLKANKEINSNGEVRVGVLTFSTACRFDPEPDLDADWW